MSINVSAETVQDITNGLLDAALAYARQGKPVFPCWERDETDDEFQARLQRTPKEKRKELKRWEVKNPRVKGGRNSATIGEKQIRQWWRRWPTAMIGMPTGKETGVFVLDIDIPDGPGSLAALEEKHGALPATTRQQTGSGGSQLFFRLPTGVDVRNSKNKIGKNLDIRGNGGFVIVPPSVNSHAGPYEWVSNGTPPADAPRWLVDLAVNGTGTKGKPRPATRGDVHPYVLKALHDECDCLAIMAPNSGRNDTLNTAAVKLGHYVAGGEIDQAEVERELLNAALQSGLPEGEARATLASGLSKGMEEPKTVPPHESSSGKNHSLGSSVPWPELQELPPKYPTAPPMTEDLCPPELVGWWKDCSELAGYPLEYIAASSMVVLGSLVGRSMRIHVNDQNEKWKVTPNMWGIIIGRPGTKKSVAHGHAREPLGPLKKKAQEDYDKKTADSAKKKWKLKHLEKVTDEKYKKLLKKDDAEQGDKEELKRLEGAAAEIQAELAELDNVRVRQYEINETTVPALVQAMSTNPNGMLLSRDELAGFIESFHRKDRESEKPAYLEMHAGNYDHTEGRICRGMTNAKLCLSILGTTQPARFQPVIDSAVKHTTDDDGFLQRFSMLVWPDNPGPKRTDRKEDATAEAMAFRVHSNLANLSPQSVGAHIPLNGDPPYLKFDSEAQALFENWYSSLEEIIRSDEMEEISAFESHLSKYTKLMPSLALLFHLIKHACDGRTNGPVTREATELAIRWIDFLEGHARKVYAAELGIDGVAVHKLAGLITEGIVQSGTTLKDIYDQGYAGLKTAEDAKRAATALQECGWLRLVKESPTGRGRPSDVVYVNPAIEVTAKGASK